MTTQTRPEQRIDEGALEGFKETFRGDVIGSEDPGYDDARRVQNGMIDRRPALIVRPADVADVISAVGFGRDQGLDIAVRSGGHSAPGFGTIDDGLVIDLSRMRGVRVDPVARTARVEGGALLGDVDHATHAFGLAVPSGIISNTGIGGLTLGGGLGHLTRKLGLTIDNLIEADVVLATGELVTASADTNPDLFWALRGGGGNFGVVTSFLFRLHPVSTVVAGPTLYALEDAAEVLGWWQDFIAQAPEDLNGFFAFLIVPPAAPFPPDLQMRQVCGIVWTYSGPAEKADEVFAPIKAFGSPLLYGVQPLPLPAWQAAFDGLYPKGAQMYWRAEFMNELSDERSRPKSSMARSRPSSRPRTSSRSTARSIASDRATPPGASGTSASRRSSSAQMAIRPTRGRSAIGRSSSPTTSARTRPAARTSTSSWMKGRNASGRHIGTTTTGSPGSRPATTRTTSSTSTRTSRPPA